ncbi:hypothetical protein QC763_0001860 [Podospora pseudopauciseta]|uniref:Uncharacterized protein n=1 Tax=Podospora pseudopauciseta TaxID=2093780 RepID=A0ABR0HW03_9PEZI|nr:hypothetical protein QC763_0001860 [Podospora pseudopauciseta]
MISTPQRSSTLAFHAQGPVKFARRWIGNYDDGDEYDDSGFYNTEWETDESWFWAQTTDEAENDHGHTMHVFSCHPANEELRKEVFIKIHEWKWSIDRRVKLKTRTESEEERKAAKEQALDELAQAYEKCIDESRTFVKWKPRMRATQRKMSMVKKVVWRLWVSGRT